MFFSMRRLIFAVACLLFVFLAWNRAPDSLSTVSPSSTPVLVDSAGPPITHAQVESDVVGRVVQVTGENEEGPSERWTFETDDFRQVRVVDYKQSGDAWTLNVAMSTNNSPKHGEAHVYLAGILRLHYERFADKWNLGEIENVTFRYSFEPTS
jgi:hypothetical protein